MAEKTKVTFSYKGMDRKGRKVEGEIDGINGDMVKAQLRQRGITPQSVRKKPKPLFSSGDTGKKIKASDIAVFARQMATMMSSGVPLVQAFEIVGSSADNPRMKKLIYDIKNDVEGGANFADALAAHPDHFDSLFVNLVASGEASGTLETLLDKVATYKEKSEAIKKKIKKAMTYPIAVMVMAAVVTVILMVFVVPQFESIFQGFGADLPAFTQLVVDASRWMRSNIFILIAITVGLGFGFIQLKKRVPAVGIYLDKLSLKLPIFGGILNTSIHARFARTLATMFAAGVPLVEAMNSISGAVNNHVYEQAIYQIRDEISSGDPLTASMRRTNLFPNMMLAMVQIGEESGSIDSMLLKVADFYEEEVDNTVDNLSSLMEPMIMAVLGVLVGGLVIAMYLPIFKMGQVVGG
ncbi:type II secretion system protein [gamma proteobacterium HTCC5015]|nr:type II secretion system protein [gamma proteobacterium HTCC5015]